MRVEFTFMFSEKNLFFVLLNKKMYVIITKR